MDVKSGSKENCSTKSFGRIFLQHFTHICKNSQSIPRLEFLFFFKKISTPRLMLHGSQLEIVRAVCSVGFHPGSRYG